MNYSAQPLNPSSNLAIVVNSCSLSWGKYADSGTFSAYLKGKKKLSTLILLRKFPLALHIKQI